MSDLFDPEAQQSRRRDEARADADAQAPREDGPPKTPAEPEPPTGEVERPPRADEAPSPPDETPPPPDAPPSGTEWKPWSPAADEARSDEAGADEPWRSGGVPWRPGEEPWRSEDVGWPQRVEPEPRTAPPPPPRTWNPLVRLGVPQPWRAIIDWIFTIAGAVAIVLAIKAWVVNPYRIPSSSMEPTLHCAASSSGCTSRFSDRVLANRFIYHFRDPHRGEIVVFNVPEKAKTTCGAGGVFVKRIIGLPGDTWQERNGFVYINGRKLDEPYIKKDRRDFQSWPRTKIPNDGYFMMGDNRQSSCDSRRWGVVPRKDIIGKVFAIYWPPQRIRLM